MTAQTNSLDEIETSVVVSETLELPEKSLAGLVEAVRGLFRGQGKVVQFLYRAGEPLRVERRVPARDTQGDDPSIMTPYQSVRAADLRVQEGSYLPLEAVLRGIQTLQQERYEPVALITRNRARFQRWLGADIQLPEVLRLRMLEDPDAPANVLFICGSKTSGLVQDVEYAVLLRME